MRCHITINLGFNKSILRNIFLVFLSFFFRRKNFICSFFKITCFQLSFFYRNRHRRRQDMRSRICCDICTIHILSAWLIGHCKWHLKRCYRHLINRCCRHIFNSCHTRKITWSFYKIQFCINLTITRHFIRCIKHFPTFRSCNRARQFSCCRRTIDPFLWNIS